MKEKNAIVFIRFLFIITTICLLLVSIVWFVLEAKALFIQIVAGSDYFLFKRYIAFLPGVILLSLMLSVVFIIETFKMTKVTNEFNGLINKVFIFSVSFLIIMPVFSGLSARFYASHISYDLCDGASNHNDWPIYRSIYYVANDEVCQRLTEEYESSRYKPKYKVQRSGDSLVLP